MHGHMSPFTISQLLSLSRHSHYDVSCLRRSQSPILIMTSFSLWRHSLLNWPRPPLQTYGHLTAFNVYIKIDVWHRLRIGHTRLTHSYLIDHTALIKPSQPTNLFDFKKDRILMVYRVQMVKMRNRAKFCGSELNHYWAVAFFSIFQMAALRHLGFFICLNFTLGW